MKERIKALVSAYILEVLDEDCNHFQISKERLCNEILLKFSVKFRSDSDFDDDMLFDRREYLQFALNANNKKYYEKLVVDSGEPNESQLIREIFSYYAILPPFLRELNIFREKISFLANAARSARTVRLDIGGEAVENKIEAVRRSPDTNYLVAVIGGSDYYISKLRVID